MSIVGVSPLISIIIPVFNVELYLRDCLDSIVNQSFSEIEIICVNDGSCDGSLSILHEYASRDSRIKIIDKPNGGQSVARNIALSVATGKYIAFIDSDDLVDHELCVKAYELAEKNCCDVVLYDHLDFKKPVEIQQKKRIPSMLTTIVGSDRNAILKGMNSVWTKFVRKSFIQANQISFPEGLIYEDVLVHWQLIILANKISILPEKLYYYRVQPLATTQRTDWGLSSLIVIMDYVQKFLLAHQVYDDYRDVFIKYQMESFCTVYDNINLQNKEKVMTLIEARLNNDHWEYFKSQKPLTWRARSLFSYISGDTIAKIQRKLFFFLRSCYRKLKII